MTILYGYNLYVMEETAMDQNNVRSASLERITTVELAQKFIDEQLAEIRAQVGNKKVLLALSGGVDSSVCAALLWLFWNLCILGR